MKNDRVDAGSPRLPDRRSSRRTLLRLTAAGLAALVRGGVQPAAAAGLPATLPRRGRWQSVPPGPGMGCDSAATSGIVGLVLIGPMCPVMRLDEPCPDQPFAATIIVRDAQGQEICATQSGDDGRFQIGLPPGVYELAPIAGSGGLPYAASQIVTVAPDQFSEVAISFDSGIR